ncbi:MAG: DUF4179 domain-containing protein [Lachnospiraceae bacterium]|nr:DUF4179 domain-containing protein [Lachnospiraceae bacterium]
MRSTEERIAAVFSRARELERQKRRHQTRWLTGAAGLCALLIVVVCGMMMPGLADGMSMAKGMEVYAGPTASIFQSGGALGYIIIGVLAFALGVSVTVLCIHLRRREEDNR